VHLATGRIGHPGMGPFSVTGQPNAMGGREVGGLANQLAAHMDFSDAASIDRVARFWNAPHIAKTPGLKAVDMFRAIASGKIKAVWIMGTNPAASMPDADKVRDALMACELVVVSDCVQHTDTTACADILLPAAGWGEKEGTVTNSERRISRQRAFLSAAGESRPDWWIVTQVAQRMGYADAFPYTQAAQIFREHARLSGFENDGVGYGKTTASEKNAGRTRFPPPFILPWPIFRSSDGTTDATTSHLTGETTSQSTKPSKNDGKVAGYNQAKNAGQVIGYGHSTRLANNTSQVVAHPASVEIAASRAQPDVRANESQRPVKRAFDISALSEIDDAQYDELQPVQWPVNQQHPDGTQRLFADGRFFTPSGKARMIAVLPQLPAVATDDEFPLVLNTGRIRDQWHMMTRTGKVPRLNAHSFEPYVQMHARDAQQCQLQDGGLARLTSRHGTMLARVQVSDEQRAGSVFVPMHWNDVYARSARADALVAPITDPISGQPESKHAPVRVEPYRAAWQGFVLSRDLLDFPEADYCACTLGAGYWRHEIAGIMLPENWHDWVQAALTQEHPLTGTSPLPCRERARERVEASSVQCSTSKSPAEWIEYRDAAMGRYRAACLQDGRLQAVFFIGPDQRLPEREWLASLFKQSTIDPADLAGLLTARPPTGSAANTGRTVCACYSVGEKTIINAIREQGLDSVEAIGSCLKAGTGCGSCVPEVRRILQYC